MQVNAAGAMIMLSPCIGSARLRIGLVNIYAFRPHVDHLAYLTHLVREGGHEVRFLTCDANLPLCYPRALKGTSRLRECAICRAGGIRSFESLHVSNLGTTPGPDLSPDVAERLAFSSSSTLCRTETDNELDDPDVVAVRDSLATAVKTSYSASLGWIEREQLDSVICFNGRMDHTRAVTAACEQVGIPYVTHERPWFGHGLHLTPNENCLAIGALKSLADQFRQQPLTEPQARLAGRLLGIRFLQQNELEWRLYNHEPCPAPWPTKTDRQRVLIVPSSRSEFAGHDDWRTPWSSNTEALDDLLDAWDIKPEQVVLRCHPNWGERIGQVSGERAQHLYSQWARSREIFMIAPEDKASTYDLIRQADLIVMNGGSSAVEAGGCGKPVVNLGPSRYQTAGIVQTILSSDEFAQGHRPIDPDLQRRLTLRYLYVSAARFPQFVDFVRARSTWAYDFYAGGEPDRLIDMLRTGELIADDEETAADQDAEDSVIELLAAGNWPGLADYDAAVTACTPLRIQRRLAWRWIDTARARFPLGDRW